MDNDDIPTFPSTSERPNPPLIRDMREVGDIDEVRNNLQVLIRMVSENNARMSRVEASVNTLRTDLQTVKQMVRSINMSQGGGGSIKQVKY